MTGKSVLFEDELTAPVIEKLIAMGHVRATPPGVLRSSMGGGQAIMGTMDRVNGARGQTSDEGASSLSVRLELQADFFAGIWAHYAAKRGIVEPGDIDEALNAASAVGDDRLQRESQGYVVPDSFTHGSSQQRSEWFRRGFDTGEVNQGDTFRTR